MMRKMGDQLACGDKMSDTPFSLQNRWVKPPHKGVFLMTYHTPVPQSCPPASKLGPQMILFLQELLSLSSPAPDPTIKRGRGRPATFCLQQIWLGLLLGGLQQADSFRHIWRHLSTRSQGSSPLLNVTYEAVRKRVLSAGLESLQTLFEEVSERLRQ